MTKTKNTYKKIMIYTIISLNIFLCLLSLNRLTYFTSDDYIYHYVYKSPFPTEPLEKIDGLYSIIVSQKNHYLIWNGRFVAHSLLQFFMQFGKGVFNFFNSLAFLWLGVIILQIIKSTIKVRHLNLCLLQVLLLLWLFIPEFGKTVLWMSGSANYLWMSVIYLSFFLFNLQNFKTNKLIMTVSIILGFLSGATNENSGPTIILMVILLTVWRFYTTNKISTWRIAGIISSMVGFLIMMSSPGSLQRGKQHITLTTILQNIKNINHVTLSQYVYLYLLIAILLAYLIFQNKLKLNHLYFLAILFIGYWASIYSLVLSPVLPLRVLFISTTLLVIITMYLLNICYEEINIQMILTLLLVVTSVTVYIRAVADISVNYSEVNQQVKILKHASSDDTVTLKLLSPAKTLYNPYNGTANLKKEKHAWFNVWMAEYFGVQSIIGE